MKSLTLFDARRLVEQEPNLVVLETLDDEYFDDFHLPRAKSVPLGDDFEASVRDLAIDPSTPLLVYGMDAKDTSASLAAKRLERMGFADVSLFPGGKIEWKENGLPTG